MDEIKVARGVLLLVQVDARKRLHQFARLLHELHLCLWQSVKEDALRLRHLGPFLCFRRGNLGRLMVLGRLGHAEELHQLRESALV